MTSPGTATEKRRAQRSRSPEPSAEDTLVLITCSAAKRAKPVAPIPAIERYDGVFYKVIRKAIAEDRLDRRTAIAIISAEYGLISCDVPIPYYDRRLDRAQAETLGPVVRESLCQLIRRHRFRRVLVNIGRDYAAMVKDLPELRSATWAQGSIGKRAALLKAWLRRSEVS